MTMFNHGTWPDGEPAPVRDAYDRKEADMITDPGHDHDDDDSHGGWHGDD